MSYPLSSEVIVGQATEAAQYNNLRSDALYLGGASGASGTVRDLLYSAAGVYSLTQVGKTMIRLDASDTSPVGLMIGGTIYSVAASVSLTLTTTLLPAAGRYPVYAIGQSDGTFNLSLSGGQNSRAVGACCWDGTGIIPGTLRTTAEAALKAAVKRPDAASGRLSLVSGDPCPDTDIDQAEILYFMPFRGNEIALHLFGAWEYFNFSAISLAKSGMINGMPYDIFLTADSDGLSLEAMSWGSSTARPAGTLQYVDGIRVSGSYAEKRYLGTVALNDAGYFEDSKTGRLVWNENNRLARPIISRLLTTRSQGTSHMNAWAPYYDDDAPQVRLLVPLGDCEFELTGIGLSSPISESDRGYQQAAAVGIGKDILMESPYTGNKSCSLAGTHGFGNGPMIAETENTGSDFAGYHVYTLVFWSNYSFYPAGTNLADVTGLWPGLYGSIKG